MGGLVQYKSNISYTHTHTHTHTHTRMHIQYTACVFVCFCQRLCLVAPHTHTDTQAHMWSWMRVGITLIFANAWLSWQRSGSSQCQYISHPWLFVYTSGTKGGGKTREEDQKSVQKKKNNNKNTQQIKIAAGSLLSVCHDGFLQIVRALKINLKQTHTHTQRLSYVLCVCVLRFYPEALPQIPLQPFPAPPRPPQTSRGSNPHSKDSWYGNGSVKPQISLSTTHYRLLPPINVTACALWRQEAPLLTQIAAGMRRNVWMGWWAQW